MTPHARRLYRDLLTWGAGGVVAGLALVAALKRGARYGFSPAVAA